MTTHEAAPGVTRDPEVWTGVAMVAGTPVPVYMVEDLYNDYGRVEVLLEAWPWLTEDAVWQALRYAMENPAAVRADRERPALSISVARKDLAAMNPVGKDRMIREMERVMLDARDARSRRRSEWPRRLRFFLQRIVLGPWRRPKPWHWFDHPEMQARIAEAEADRREGRTTTYSGEAALSYLRNDLNNLKREGHVSTAFHPDTTFLGDRQDGADVVWSYRVVVEDQTGRQEMDLDVWNPRLIPDANGEGHVSWYVEWDRTTYAGTRDVVPPEALEPFADALTELVGDDLREADA